MYCSSLLELGKCLREERIITSFGDKYTYTEISGSRDEIRDTECSTVIRI